NKVLAGHFVQNLEALSSCILGVLEVHKAKFFWEKNEVQRAFVEAVFSGLETIEKDKLIEILKEFFKAKKFLLASIWICTELGIQNDRIKSSSPLEKIELPNDELIVLEQRLMKTLKDAGEIDLPKNYFPLRGLLLVWTVWTESNEFSREWIKKLIDNGHVLWVLTEFVITNAWATKLLIKYDELLEFVDIQAVYKELKGMDPDSKLDEYQKEAVDLFFEKYKETTLAK
ncbi:hypothetical protein KJ865_02825, partial [Myxococcota bacterium]|nr:hypothetical protein [Myxococcota bacterium]